MEMMVRVAAVGITAALLGAVLRKSVPELALLLALAAGLALPISGAEAIAKSWPDFLEAIKPLGAEVEHVG